MLDWIGLHLSELMRILVVPSIVLSVVATVIVNFVIRRFKK